MTTEKIEIFGTEYPIKIGYYAIKHAVREQEKEGNNVSMENILQGNIEVQEALLFYGLELGAKLEKTECPLKREDAEIWLDDCFQTFLALIPKFFPTAPTGQAKKPQTRPDTKKKLT